MCYSIPAPFQQFGGDGCADLILLQAKGHLLTVWSCLVTNFCSPCRVDLTFR